MNTDKPHDSVEETIEEFQRKGGCFAVPIFEPKSGVKLRPNLEEPANVWLRQALLTIKAEGALEERETILGNILKWSKTATVVETIGRGGAKRATKKLRDSLTGSYHFLYQAVRLSHPTPEKTYQRGLEDGAKAVTDSFDIKLRYDDSADYLKPENND